MSLQEWYADLIEGRLASAQYRDHEEPTPGNDRNCGEDRHGEIVQGEIVDGYSWERVGTWVGTHGTYERRDGRGYMRAAATQESPGIVWWWTRESSEHFEPGDLSVQLQEFLDKADAELRGAGYELA